MSLIRVNGGEPGDAKREYVEFWADMMPTVATAVVESFETSKMRHPTDAEARDRTDYAKKLVDQLRVDFGWSRQRIRDHIGIALRAKLAGLELDLSTLGARVVW